MQICKIEVSEESWLMRSHKPFIPWTLPFNKLVQVHGLWCSVVCKTRSLWMAVSSCMPFQWKSRTRFTHIQFTSRWTGSGWICCLYFPCMLHNSQKSFKAFIQWVTWWCSLPLSSEELLLWIRWTSVKKWWFVGASAGTLVHEPQTQLSSWQIPVHKLACVYL